MLYVHISKLILATHPAEVVNVRSTWYSARCLLGPLLMLNSFEPTLPSAFPLKANVSSCHFDQICVSYHGLDQKELAHRQQSCTNNMDRSVASPGGRRAELAYYLEDTVYVLIRIHSVEKYWANVRAQIQRSTGKHICNKLLSTSQVNATMSKSTVILDRLFIPLAMSTSTACCTSSRTVGKIFDWRNTHSSCCICLH